MYFFTQLRPSTESPIIGKKVKVVIDNTPHMPPSKIVTAEVLEVSGDMCRIRFVEVATNCSFTGEAPNSAKEFLSDPENADTFVIPIIYLWAREP